MTITLKKIIFKIILLLPLTDNEIKRYINYSMCKKHTGKMSGIQSISTNNQTNPFCIARKNIDNFICKHCYADRQCKYYKGLSKKLERNTMFFTNYRVKRSQVPKIKSKYFRFEAFGDIQNVLQVKNYYTIARANPQTTFALWTKNLQFVALAGTKPRNLIVVYSEPVIDNGWTIADFEAFQYYNPYVDKVFCVLDKSVPDETINCGARNCLECGKCYNRKKANMIIRERLK